MDLLDRRRVYIVPTRPGLMMFGVVGLILIGATNYDNALAYILCFLLLGLMFSAMLRTWRNLKGLGLEVQDAEPIHVGSPARFELQLCDPDARERYAFTLRRLLPGKRYWWWRPRFEGEAGVETVPAAGLRVGLSVPTARRGWLTLDRLEIASSFPLGVFRTWGYFRCSARCLVYPAAVGQRPLPGVGESAADDTGPAGPGVDDLAGLRGYVAGDSLRSVHWRASARSDLLLVKKMQGGGRGELVLRWQDTGGVGDTETRIAQLAQWVLQADRAGLRYGLELPALQIAPEQGPLQRERLLRALALMPE